MRIRKGTKGFTLIELMIVIAIIAILAAILVPNFLRARAQGMVTACKSNCKNIGTALEMYSTDHSGHYPLSANFQTGLTANAAYLRALPQCPSAGSMSYSYTATSDPDSYTTWCTGSHHTAVGITQAGYPQYNSVEGLVVPAVAP